MFSRFYRQPTRHCFYTEDPLEITTPADSLLVASAPSELRNLKIIIEERLNTLLSGAGTPTPPVTIVDATSQIGGAGVDPTPLRVTGAQVDLRGMTWRLPTADTDSATRTATTSWSPVGSPGGVSGDGTFFVNITPVAAESLLEIRFQCIAYLDTPGSGGDTQSVNANNGAFRIVEDAGGGGETALTPIAAVGSSGTTGGWTHVNLVCYTTGLSAETRFEPQFILNGAAVSLQAFGVIAASHFSILEHV